MFVQGRKGAGRGALGRVQERDVSSEYEFALVVMRANLLPRQVLCCHCQHAEPVVAEAVILLLQPDHQIRVHGGQLAIEFKMRATEEDLLGSTLSEEDRFTSGVLH